MNKPDLPGYPSHHPALRQQPVPGAVGPSALRGSLPLQQPLFSQGLQEMINGLNQLQRQRELQALQSPQQTQPTTLSSPTTGMPFTVAPAISPSAALSADNSQRALGVFGPAIFEDHHGRSANMSSPMPNREMAESGFSHSPSLKPALQSIGARLEAPDLQLPDQSKNPANTANALNSNSASSGTALKRRRDADTERNFDSAPRKSAGGLATLTAAPTSTTTTTTTNGLASFTNAADKNSEPVKKKPRVETFASSDMREPFASLSSEFDKMQSITKRYKSATEIAQTRLGHDFLEDEDIQSYANEFKKECVCLVRFCLKNNFLGVCEKIIFVAEKFYADTFPPALGAGEQAGWRLADELAPRDLDNLCALLNRSNLTKLLVQRDEFRQHESVKSSPPHEVLRGASLMLPAARSEVADVPRALEGIPSSEPVATARVSHHMAIITESPTDAGSFLKNFLDLIEAPKRITQENIDNFIANEKNFQTFETAAQFLRAIFKLLSTIKTHRSLFEKFDKQAILQSALKKLFSKMQDKQASREKIYVTNRFLVGLAISSAAMCELIVKVLVGMKPSAYGGIVYKADFEIIAGLHDAGVPNFQDGIEMLTNPIVINLRDGNKLSKEQVVSHFATAAAGSNVNTLKDYFKTLEFLLDELLSGRVIIQDMAAKNLIALALDRLLKTSSATMLNENVSQYLLRLAIKSKDTCDTLLREFSDMPEEMKRKFRVVRKMEFFSRAHAALKARFYVPAPSRQSAGGKPAVTSSALTRSQEAEESARKKSAATTVVGPAIEEHGRTESRAATIKRPIKRTTANSSATYSNVPAEQTAASANRQHEGEKSLFVLEDE